MLSKVINFIEISQKIKGGIDNRTKYMYNIHAEL